MNKDTWECVKKLIDQFVENGDFLRKLLSEKEKEIADLNKSLDEIHS
jgi:hypothetical protein